MNLEALHHDADAARQADAAMDPLDQAVTESENRTAELDKKYRWNSRDAELRDQWAKSREERLAAYQTQRDGRNCFVASHQAVWSEIDAVAAKAMNELPHVRDTLAALQADFPNFPFFRDQDSTEQMRVAVRAILWRKFQRVLAAITAAEGNAR